ncbi:MAG: N-acetyltransferase family protein [Gaiellaceae bacterium]
MGDGALRLRRLAASDWPAVEEIYAAGIATGDATFETDTPSWGAWDAAHLEGHRLVALQDGEVVGWAALARVSQRACYAGVAEVSVYVAPAARGRGVGRALLERLVADSEVNGVWTLQAGVFPENESSLRLHRSCGFRMVGVRASIARQRDRWRDVVLLERRSPEIR